MPPADHCSQPCQLGVTAGGLTFKPPSHIAARYGRSISTSEKALSPGRPLVDEDRAKFLCLGAPDPPWVNTTPAR